MPVFAASALRPLTVRAASSNPSVVRMPSALSLEAANDGKPSISEIGYVMMLNMKEKCALIELTEPRGPCDDLPHLIRPDFVATEPKKFTRDVLNLAHTQTKSHQLGAERHQAATHQASEPAVIA